MRHTPQVEKTSALVARRTAHYVHDRRIRTQLGRPPELPFPGMHESLAVHLVAVLPAWLLARLSLEQYLAWTRSLTRMLARSATGLVRSGLVLRRVWWRTLDAGRWIRSRAVG